MNKRIFVFVVALIPAILAALPISLVSATKPMPVSGTITVIPLGPPSAPKMAGKSDNRIATPESNVVFAGGIVGAGTYSGRWVIHNYGVPGNVWVNSKGSYEIEATVDGKSGTLYIEAGARSGSGKPARWRIVGATGGLAGLHGQGTFAPSTPGDIFNYDYVGQVHFDP